MHLKEKKITLQGKQLIKLFLFPFCKGVCAKRKEFADTEYLSEAILMSTHNIYIYFFYEEIIKNILEKSPNTTYIITLIMRHLIRVSTVRHLYNDILNESTGSGTDFDKL